MTRKPFEQLTFADDFMFCKVMEHESLCRPFLEMLFTAQIGKITYLSTQDNVTAHSDAKTVRLDVLVKDEHGTSYDIEMSFSDRHPCLSENTSFAIRQNIAAARTSGIHAAAEPDFSKKAFPLAFCK